MIKTLTQKFVWSLAIGVLCTPLSSIATNKNTPNVTKVAEQAVSGRVIASEDGQGMPGASVSLKGTNKGVVTDVDGNFKINVPGATSVLVFSAIGYVTQEVTVGNKTSINVTLEVDQKALEEVVVVGYGAIKKSQMTGAISQVTAKQIQEMPITNLAQSLQGRAAGVDVSQSGSKPGSAPRILIRGRRSITASNDPLYVVDGIPLSAGYEDINPNDIQSIEVLKDATATAIYGARGANGVILVTTKRGGNKGKTTVTVDTYLGQSKAIDKIDLFNGSEFADYVREAYRATGLYKDAAGNLVPTGKTDPAADAKIAVLGGDPKVAAGLAAGTDTRYQDLLLKTGLMQNHTIGIQGGNDRTSFYVSGGFFQDIGITDLLSFERSSLRANIDHTVNKWFKMGLSSYLMYSDRSGENLNPYSNTLNANPLGSAYEADGKTLIFEPTNDALLSNPLSEIVPGAQIDQTKRYRVFNSLFTEFTLAKGLKFRTNFGPDFTISRSGRFIGSQTNARRNGDAIASSQNNIGYNYTLENILSYGKEFGKHSINATGLHSIQRDNFENYRIEVQGVPAATQEFYGLGAATSVNGVSSNLVQWTLNSYMGRVNYAFDDKYLLTLTLRRDGSSRFGENTKYGNFPGVAFGWNLMNEPFMKNLTVFDLLKVRAGWGKVGNQGVIPYQTQGLLGRTSYAWGATGAFGYRPNTIGNADLRWESSATANAGIDFSLARGRVQGSLEFYETNTKDLLLADQLPGSIGFSAVTRNVGHTRNRGIELGLTTINVKRNSFKWTTDFTFARNNEAIVELYNGKVDDIGNRWFIGKPLNSYFDFKKIGIWQTNEADLAKSFGSEVGQIKIQDTDKDGKITAADRVLLGSDIPDFSAGITNRFEYKGFDFNFFFFGRFGNEIVSGFHQNNNQLAGRYQQIKVDYWTPDNPTNEFPRPKSTQEFPVYNTSLIYFDGSFIKLRNVNFGYSFNNSVAKKVGAESVRVFASIQQPYIWSEYRSKYNGIDPEAAITGSATGLTAVNSGITPSTMVSTFGLNVKF